MISIIKITFSWKISSLPTVKRNHSILRILMLILSERRRNRRSRRNIRKIFRVLILRRAFNRKIMILERKALMVRVILVRKALIRKAHRHKLIVNKRTTLTTLMMKARKLISFKKCNHRKLKTLLLLIFKQIILII
jgi:hypothetical protein